MDVYLELASFVEGGVEEGEETLERLVSRVASGQRCDERT